MIQSNELRIGNYVSTEIHGIGFVEAISGNDILYSRNYDSIPLQQFNSITLTREIVSKLDLFPVVLDKQDGVYWMDFNWDTIEIKYLHQLQNLYFALTGKELEINL